MMRADDLDAALLHDQRAVIPLSCDPGVLTNWAWSRGSVATIRFVRGGRMTTRADLMHEWAAALQFPYYFGENWNAFDEVMADLEWLPEGRLLVVVLDAPRMLPDAGDRQAFSSLVEDVAVELRDGGRVLSLVLQSSPE